MRIRTVKPEFWSDEKTGTLSMPAALLFLAMFNFADDKGRLRGVPSLLKAQAFPYRPEIDIEAALSELLAKKLVRPYQARGQAYLEIINFLKHQVINKPSKKTLLPEPETYEITEENKHSGSTTVGLRESSGSVPVALSESSGSTTPRKGKEGKGKERKGKDLNTLSPQNSATSEQKTTSSEEEKATEAKPESAYKSLKTALEASYKQKYGEDYLFLHKKDGSALKRLIGLYEPNLILRRFEQGMSSEGYLKVTGIADLLSKWPKLVAAESSTSAKPRSIFAASKAAEPVVYDYSQETL
jgi:hypothetical protein